MDYVTTDVDDTHSKINVMVDLKVFRICISF